MLRESYPLFPANEPVAADTDLLVTNTYTLKAGDPLDEDTFLGPLITEDGRYAFLPDI